MWAASPASSTRPRITETVWASLPGLLINIVFACLFLGAPVPSLANGRQVWSVAVDPTDNRNVYVGTQPGGFRSTDGGKSWRKVLYIDPQTACSDIASDPHNSNILYAGMYTYRRWAWYLNSGGGNTAVYKSVDGGETWERLSGKDRDRGLPKGDMDRIGIAVAPSDPNVVYVGTGENNPRNSASYGDGVYKSTDGGATWTNVGLPNSGRIGRIVIHPSNPDIVFVAAQGYSYGPQKDRGLYRTTDGGRTWAHTLFVDAATTGVDLAMDPATPAIVYASLSNGLYKSTDGGATWAKLAAPGLTGTGVTIAAAPIVCATCRARVLEGQVRMDRNFALQSADLKAGFVLTCQMRATGDCSIELPYESGAALAKLSKRLAALPIPVIGRIASDRLLLDLRCLEDETAFTAQLDLLPALP